MSRFTKPINIMIALVLATALFWNVFSVLLASSSHQTDIVERSLHKHTKYVTIQNPILKNNYQEITIIVDDFVPQPIQGQSSFFYNRLDGDRGQLGDVQLDWGKEQVTATLNSGSWGGLWTSLQHPIYEAEPINFSAILPGEVNPAYQNAVSGLQVQISNSTPDVKLRIELKDEQVNQIRWTDAVTLTGGEQQLHFSLPVITDTTSLLWFMEDADIGDFVTLDLVSLTVTNNITDVAEAAFVWSYGMLLSNWDANTGLVRDQGKTASGEFDAVQSTGSLAAASGIASQLGIIDEASAKSIVNSISNTLLTELPPYHGLWPHWVRITATDSYTIVNNTEWSSIDTAIAAIGLLEAQMALGLETQGTEEFLQEIDWGDLVTPTGISHGYAYDGERLPYTWDTFGGESWLVALIYASATGQVATIPFSTPPTANGSGFIDELAWLFAPAPKTDYWGTDWQQYRSDAAAAQTNYYSQNYPNHCFDQLGLYGLSASEVPVPSAVTAVQIYQAFGLGGRSATANDGSALLGFPVAVPHYAGLIASLRPEDAGRLFEFLINNHLFTPLNNVESFSFPENASGCEEIDWNHLQGSWNLSLQALGWGRYLAESRGQMPVLWKSLTENEFLRSGYELLAPFPLFSVSIEGPSYSYTHSPTTYTAHFEPLSATLPVTITWNNGLVGTTATYEWDIPGNHTIVVTATNPGGSVVTQTQTISVYSQVFLPIIIKH